MTAIQTGFYPASATATDDDGDVATAEQFSMMVGGNLIVAESQEELDNIIAMLTLKTGKPIDEISEADFGLHFQYGHFKLEPNYDGEHKATFSLTDEGRVAMQEFTDTEFFGEKIPFYPEGTEAYLGSSYKPVDMNGEDASIGTAGFKGAAQAIYNANYPDGEQLRQIDKDQLDPDVRAMLEYMFGANTQLDQGHLNTLKAMGLVSGPANATGKGGAPNVGTWLLTPGEGQGMELLAEFKTVGAEGDESSMYVPSMGLFNFSPEQRVAAEKTDELFNEGALVTGKTPENVEDIARNNVLLAMGENSTPLPDGVAVAQGSPEQAMLNELYGKPANNTDFTAEELNTAIAMGLITFDPATGAFANTANGTAYAAAAAVSDGSAPAADDPAATPAPARTFGSHPEYANRVQNESRIDKTSEDADESDGDRYNRDELKSRGFPDWFLDWLFAHFANSDGIISEETLGSLVKEGYLTHESRDKKGRGKDRYGMTEQGVQLVASDPTLSEEQRRSIFVEGMGLAEFARDNDGSQFQGEYWGRSLNHANFEPVRDKYNAQYDQWMQHNG